MLSAAVVRKSPGDFPSALALEADRLGADPAGIGTSFGIGGSRGGKVTGTELSVALKNRSEGTTLWEGRATRATEPGAESPVGIVETLESVLFQDFPGESGRTIMVE